MAAGDETERILGSLRSHLDRLTDNHTRTMAAAWARAWDDVAPELTAAIAELRADALAGRLTRSKIVRARRLTKGLDLIEARLSGLFDQSAATVLDPLRDVVDHAGRTTDRLISSQLPPGTQVNGWDRVDPAQVEAILQRTTEQITKASFPLASAAVASMKRELVRGMLTGTNPRDVARLMVQRTEGLFNGGLSRAMTIARTEMLDAQRAAAQLGEKANADVLSKWVWSASMSVRTCPACWSMNGREFPLEVSGPDGHQNCRCVRVPKTKTWRELGFDIDEPPSLLPDAETRFAALSQAERLEILGPSRLAAWQAGEFPMSKWAVKRSTTGWRDSWIPANAPAAFKGARRAAFDVTAKPWKFGRGAKRLGNIPKATLQAIQRVHEVPHLSDPLRVLPLTAKPSLGGQFRPTDLTLRLNPKGHTKALTTAHEFGHYLDFQMFGEGKTMASAKSRTPEWVALRAAIAKTPEVRALKRAIRDHQLAQVRDHARYLVMDEELFARAYAQWIASKTGRRSLERDLLRIAKSESVNPLRQWTSESFAPIAKALDDLFESRLRP